MSPVPDVKALSDARSSDQVREAVNTQMENCTHQRGMVYKKMFMGLILFQLALLLSKCKVSCILKNKRQKYF